ncbi:MAG: Mth938-like domain-containing protein [Alphaproteobacteria bacterium]
MAGPAPLPPAGRPLIDSYGPGRFRVGGIDYAGSILVLPTGAAPWPVATLPALSIESLAPITAPGAGVDILLLGCGARPAAVAPALRQALKSARVALEAMDTGAACRTYNLLAGEGRRVAAALIALG